MRYLSLFSGIEAASVAWSPLGWHCVGVAEIEPFANAVLAHHYPDVLNLGSVVDLRDRLLAGDDVAGLLSNPPDLIVGGSPCQAWSVAGSRKGLSDPRGQLTLVYAEIIHAIRPEFIVWENVPGVLSAKDNGFGHLLGSLAGHGEPIPVPPGHKRWSNAGVVAGPLQGANPSWTLAWRILDAQHFGVPQRRRRVFLVGCSAASGRDPSEILFERQGMPGNSAPRGKARKDIAPTLASRAAGGGLRPAGLRPAGGLGTDFDLDEGLIPEVYALQAGTTRENPDSGPDGVGVQKNIAYTLEARSEAQMVAVNTQTAFGGNNTGGSIRVATAVNACASASGRMDFESETFVVELAGCEPAANSSMAPVAFDCKAGGNTSFSIGDKPGTLRGEGFDASEDGTGRGIPLVPEISCFKLNGDKHGTSQETYPETLLRELRQEIGEKTFAKWGFGILDSLQPTEILRSALHEPGVRPATFSRSWMVCSALGFPVYGSGWLLQSLREAECARCASQGWEPPEQLARELGAYLQELSQPGAQAARFMHDLRQASESSGLLRQTLSTIQNMGKPIGVQEKSARSVAHVIRRLTPMECEFLMGFPRNYTAITYRGKPAADGNKYKALGNSMAVPVMRWIGERINREDL